MQYYFVGDTNLFDPILKKTFSPNKKKDARTPYITKNLVLCQNTLTTTTMSRTTTKQQQNKSPTTTRQEQVKFGANNNKKRETIKYQHQQGNKIANNSDNKI